MRKKTEKLRDFLPGKALPYQNIFAVTDEYHYSN
jgi:hypothetical protein